MHCILVLFLWWRMHCKNHRVWRTANRSVYISAVPLHTCELQLFGPCSKRLWAVSVCSLRVEEFGCITLRTSMEEKEDVGWKDLMPRIFCIC